MTRRVLLISDHDSFDPAPLQAALLEDDYTLAVVRSEDSLRHMASSIPTAVILDTAPDAIPALCSAIKGDPATASTSVLATARTPEDRLAALHAGASEVLCAPLDRDEVLIRLRTIDGRPAYIPASGSLDILGCADLLSHDLKSPLGIIISSLEVLREDGRDRLNQGNPEGQLEISIADDGIHAAERLIRLLEDLIDVARLEAADYERVIERVDLAAQVKYAVARLFPVIARKGIGVDVTDYPDLPHARADSMLVRRICYALLDNVLKFTSPGDQVAVAFQVEADRVALYVTDHGRPIAPQFEESLFQSSMQWKAREQGSRTSVAMGMQFARAAARYMDGALTAFSDPDAQTTTFCLRLPRAE